MIKKQNLFQARIDGYHVYRIPGIVVTENNIVIVSTEARKGSGGDWENIDILIRRSVDSAKSFEKKRLVVDHRDYGDGPINNFVMISDKVKKRVVALFCHNYSRVFRCYIDADGLNVSKPKEITDVFNKFKKDYSWKVCATGPGHGIQSNNGRLIVPVWLSDGTGKEMGEGNLGHRPSVVSSVYSDDYGKTWERGEIICKNNDYVNGKLLINPSETIVVELSNSAIMFNIRNESEVERRLIAVSQDGAKKWKILGFDDSLLEPVCMASIIKSNIKSNINKEIIVFINPDTLENDIIPPGNKLRHDRKRLTVKCSGNDGMTWDISKILELGPAGYSDLAQLSTGEFLCFYECDLETKMCDDKYLRLAKFDLDWILN